MECPKCGAQIEKNTLVCPNCKKVLKIVCPRCKTINSSNICKKCGEVIVLRCSKCGKINLSKNKKCLNCDYPLDKSAIINESNTADFALVKLTFPNAESIREKLGSNKLFNKFKSRFDMMILSYLEPLGLRRQIVNGKEYLIRFNKDYTFNSSAKNAINSTIALVNLFVSLNTKLYSKFKVVLKCNLTILKKNVEDNPTDTGEILRVNLLNQNLDADSKISESFQVITGDDFYEIYSKDYKLESLDSVLIDGNMIRFYEINLKEFINQESYLEDNNENDENFDLPEFVKNAIEDQNELTESISQDNDFDNLYDIDGLITFDEVACEFITGKNIKVLDTVFNLIKDNPRRILALKGDSIIQPHSLKLLETVNSTDCYQNVIPITCYEQMKYNPYGFFRDLIMTIFEYSISQKLWFENDYSVFDESGFEDYVQSLIELTQRPMQDSEEVRKTYFDAFLNLFSAIPNSVICIENFDKIDSSSLFLLGQFFEHFDQLDVNYIISYSKDFSLHKQFPFLLSIPFYTEVKLSETKFLDILKEDESYYENVVKDYYFQHIAKYTSGSLLYLDYSIQYLIESGIYAQRKNKLYVVNKKTTVLPSDIYSLTKRRLNLLKNEPETLKFLLLSTIVGPRTDIKTIEAMGFSDWKKIAQDLQNRGYLFIYNSSIYFPNYEILSKCVLEFINKSQLEQFREILFNSVFTNKSVSYIKALLYEYSAMNQDAVFEWEKLANCNLSMGDYCAYMCCCEKILQLIDSHYKNDPKEKTDKIKKSIYENIALNMSDYNPEKQGYIGQKALDGLEKAIDNSDFIFLCAKMIDGAIDYGQYIAALGFIHRVLPYFSTSSINPESNNFDLRYLITTLTHMKVLFFLGRYTECLNLTYNIISVLDNSKITRINFEHYSKDAFEDLLTEFCAYSAISAIITLKNDISEFLNIINTLFSFIPKDFEIFNDLQKLIFGIDFDFDKNKYKNGDVFSSIFANIISAFKNHQNSMVNFAKEIYKAKIIAKDTRLIGIELFCDSIIGYSYYKLGNYKKALNIITKISTQAQKTGCGLIVHLCAYFMSLIDIKYEKYDVAFGLLNNSNIMMTKNPISDYLVLLNRTAMYHVLKIINQDENAKICISQADHIISKYGLNFNLNIDIDELMGKNQ